MDVQITTRDYSKKIVVYFILAILAPVYLINIIPSEQWSRGVPFADSRLNLWALTHQWKVLPSSPGQIWNGNAFYPAKRTITGSDHLFTQALTGLPIYKATRNPFLAYHFVLFAGYAIGAWGMFLLGLLVFRHAGGALAAAVFFTVALPRSIQAVGHIQIAYLAWMPWSVYFLHRMYRRNSFGVVFGFVVTTTLHFLSGWYIALFHAIILAVLMPSLALKHRQIQTFYAGIAALAVVAVLVLPFALPYAGRSGNDIRTLHQYSAQLMDFVRPASYTVFSRSHQPFWSETTLWMGLTAPIVALLGIFFKAKPDRMGRRPTVFPYLLLAAGGVVLACGPNLPLIPQEYNPWMLLTKLPGIDGIRAPARAVFIAVFAISILFGRTIWLIEKKCRSRNLCRIITFILVALVMIENFPLMKLAPARIEAPEVYEWLKVLPPTMPVAEAPCFYGTDLWAFSADNMMYAALHGRPIANGYTRYPPEQFPEISDAVKRLPSPSAIRFLKSIGIDIVIIHPQMYFHKQMHDLLAQAQTSSNPAVIINHVTQLSNNHYYSMVSPQGQAMEIACLQSPYMTLIDRFGKSLVFYLNDLQMI
jgi:hypothetical protein